MVRGDRSSARSRDGKRDGRLRARLAVMMVTVSVCMSGNSTVSAQSDDFFTVGVIGDPSALDGHLELQIGSTAWTIERAGYQVVESAGARPVAVWRTSDCRLLIRFEASPESGRARNTIYLGDGTHVTFERGGSDGIPTGPVSRRHHAPSCRLPDTSTIGPTDAGPRTVGAAVGRVVALVLSILRTLKAG